MRGRVTCPRSCGFLSRRARILVCPATIQNAMLFPPTLPCCPFNRNDKSLGKWNQK